MVGSRPSLCNDRLGGSRQLSLEVLQVRYLRGGGRPCDHAATSRSSRPGGAQLQFIDKVWSLLRFSHLSWGPPGRCSFFGALDDRIRGLGGDGDAGSLTPRCSVTVSILGVSLTLQTVRCGHTHRFSAVSETTPTSPTTTHQPLLFSHLFVVSRLNENGFSC